MKLEPYWPATAPAVTGATRERLSTRADVVVVGAGFTGLSAALSLARAGAEVVVLEAGGILSEASGRNGGHCNTGTIQNFADLIASVGLDAAKRYYQAHADAVQYVEDTIRAEQIDCDFVRRGKLKLARKASHMQSLAASQRALHEHIDRDVELLSKADVRREVASDAFYGGLLEQRSAQMHMGKFGVGLAEAAVRHGARIFEQYAVTGLTSLGGTRHRVQTTQGTIDANRVLLATGCSHHGPFDWWQRRVVPVGSFVTVTEPLDAALLESVLPQRRTYVTSLNIGNYFRTTPDHRLIWGGRARFARSNPASDAKSGRILQQSLAQLLPDLAGVRVEYCWGGLVEATADRLPRAGQHQGVYYAMGYSGHGTQMATYMGDVMADVLLGKPRDNPWARKHWPALPGYAGRAWFLPLAGLYYRFKDFVS